MVERESVLLLEAGTGQNSEENDASVNEHIEVDETLVDSIWNELEGQVGREKIRSAIIRARAKYATARVNTFVPILVRRDVLDELRSDEEQMLGFSSWGPAKSASAACSQDPRRAFFSPAINGCCSDSVCEEIEWAVPDHSQLLYCWCQSPVSLSFADDGPATWFRAALLGIQRRQQARQVPMVRSSDLRENVPWVALLVLWIATVITRIMIAKEYVFLLRHPQQHEKTKPFET